MAVVAEARSVTLGRRPAAPQAIGTFYTVAGGNDIFWRAEAPARAIGAILGAIPEDDAPKVLGWPHRGGPLPWSIVIRTTDGAEHTLSSKTAWQAFCKTRPATDHIGTRVEFPKHEGVAVFARPDLYTRGTLAIAMRDQGIRVVMESDDNYLADPTQNLFMRKVVSAQEQEWHAKAMVAGDACVFATAALRDIYAKQFRARFGKRGLPEMHVCRNSIARADWPERLERDGSLRVGFMGSPSHVWDVNLAYAAFKAAKAEGCETVAIGYNPADPDPELPDVIDTDDGPHEWRSAKSADYKAKWADAISKHIPWVAPADYHRIALPLDIGLAPLRTDGFTLGKSDVKAVEYSIAGAAVICQNNPVYNSAGWRHNVNCLMAGSPREFAEQTVRLIRDPKLRFDLVTAAQEMVANERNEITLQEEWRYALNG